MKRFIKSFLQSTYRRANRRLAIRKNVTYHKDLRVGSGSLVMAPDNLSIGKQVIIGMNCWIACNGEIGEGVLISSYVGIVGKYDHDTRHMGKYMSQARWIYDDDAPPRDERHAVHIEPDVWIGFGVTILSGIRIGRGSIIAAGSIVTKDVAPYTVVAGNPARQISVRMSDAEAQIHEDALRAAAG